jgi:hypothetical protein
MDDVQQNVIFTRKSILMQLLNECVILDILNLRHTVTVIQIKSFKKYIGCVRKRGGSILLTVSTFPVEQKCENIKGNK